MNTRPMPPSSLVSHDGIIDSVVSGVRFLPAHDIYDWVRETFLEESGALHNPDHKHLLDAQIAFLWTNLENNRQMNQVAGMAEIPMFRCGAWQKGRQEQQLCEWFGGIPDFLITLDACYAEHQQDAVFCALVEHELYHCAQLRDAFGEPKFNKEGKPKFGIMGHDVEEFVGIVRRYGAGSAAGSTAKLVEAANRPAEVAQIDIARACGVCMLRAA